jgi:hypothetical protein
MASPPNPAVVPTVIYGYLLCLLSSERPATQSMEGSRATFVVLYRGYHGSSVMTQKSRYDRFPPRANGWGTTYPIMDMAPPLLAEEEGPLI